MVEISSPFSLPPDQVVREEVVAEQLLMVNPSYLIMGWCSTLQLVGGA